MSLLSTLTQQQQADLLYDWGGFWARPKQIPPGEPGSAANRTDWKYWLFLAGRGCGKTRTGAELVRHWSRDNNYVNLIGATTDDARDIMIEGESGILAICPNDERPHYQKSQRKLLWPNGSVSLIFTADEPERLRGKQHAKLWLDEACAYRRPEAWDQAQFGLRLGNKPQAFFSTTPKPIKLIRDLIADPLCIVTRGTSYENRANLPPDYWKIIAKYEGTRMGRQELLAELLDDVEGALWTLAMIEAARVDSMYVPPLQCVVIAIDPAVTSTEKSDETGIGAVGIGFPDGNGNQHCYVLEDVSGRYTPSQWAKQACRLMLKHNADRIVGEVNNGGDLIEANLRTIMPGIPYRSVRASRGKLTRAEPVSALYERGLVHHVRNTDDPANLSLLEEQMTTWTPRSGEKSPDRMDWLVWAITDLVIQPEANYIASIWPGVQVSAY